MCGRYGFVPTDNFLEKYHIDLPLFPKYNAAPGNLMPVIVNEDGKNIVKTMKWGLIPFWAKDPKIGYRTINARAEDIDIKPSFRKPFKSQRCLVPASGFYEWQKTDADKSIPYYIHLKSEPVFSFAGLFDIWKDVEGYPINTFTIITTTPNDLVIPIHDRMPVILPEKKEELWSDNTISDTKKILSLLKPYQAKEMERYQVSTLVNSPQNDYADLIKKVSGEVVQQESLI